MFTSNAWSTSIFFLQAKGNKISIQNTGGLWKYNTCLKSPGNCRSNSRVIGGQK